MIFRVQWVKIRNKSGNFRLVKKGNRKYRLPIPRLRRSINCTNRRVKRSDLSLSLE